MMWACRFLGLTYHSIATRWHMHSFSCARRVPVPTLCGAGMTVDMSVLFQCHRVAAWHSRS